MVVGQRQDQNHAKKRKKTASLTLRGSDNGNLDRLLSGIFGIQPDVIESAVGRKNAYGSHGINDACDRYATP
jgi:hypothetical protein